MDLTFVGKALIIKKHFYMKSVCHTECFYWWNLKLSGVLCTEWRERPNDEKSGQTFVASLVLDKRGRWRTNCAFGVAVQRKRSNVDTIIALLTEISFVIIARVVVRLSESGYVDVHLTLNTRTENHLKRQETTCSDKKETNAGKLFQWHVKSKTEAKPSTQGIWSLQKTQCIYFSMQELSIFFNLLNILFLSYKDAIAFFHCQLETNSVRFRIQASLIQPIIRNIIDFIENILYQTREKIQIIRKSSPKIWRGFQWWL